VCGEVEWQGEFPGLELAVERAGPLEGCGVVVGGRRRRGGDDSAVDGVGDDGEARVCDYARVDCWLGCWGWKGRGEVAALISYDVVSYGYKARWNKFRYLLLI
jgi:hypothetical protein